MRLEKLLVETKKIKREIRSHHVPVIFVSWFLKVTIGNKLIIAAKRFEPEPF